MLINIPTSNELKERTLMLKQVDLECEEAFKTKKIARIAQDVLNEVRNSCLEMISNIVNDGMNDDTNLITVIPLPYKDFSIDEDNIIVDKVVELLNNEFNHLGYSVKGNYIVAYEYKFELKLGFEYKEIIKEATKLWSENHNTEE